MHLVWSLTNIRGRRVLFVNDCLHVVLAMQKGSNSHVLQADAEYIAKVGLEAGALLTFLHVPGTRMIEAGVDGAGGAARGASSGRRVRHRHGK